MKHKFKKLLTCLLSMVMVLSLMSGIALADDTDTSDSDSSSVTAAATYTLDASLSCYVSGMGGIEFADGIFKSLTVTVNSDNTYTVNLTFDKSSVTIYSVTCDTFIDATDSKPGYYDTDGNLVTEGVTYTLSEDTALDSNSNSVHYVDSMTFTVSSLSCISYLYLYINSNVMGVQFCDGSGSGSSNNPGVLTPYKAELTLDSGTSGLDPCVLHNFKTTDDGASYMCYNCGLTYTQTTAAYAGTGDYSSASTTIDSMISSYFGYNVYVSDALSDGSYNVMLYFGGTSGYSSAIGDLTVYDSSYTTASSTVSSQSFSAISSDPVYIFNVSSYTDPIYVSLYVGGSMNMTVTFSITAAALNVSTDYVERWGIGPNGSYSVIATMYENTNDDGNVTYSLVVTGEGDTMDFGSSSSVPWYSSYRTGLTSVSIADTVTPDDMDYWFYGCTALTLDDGFSLPGSVTSANYIFASCTSITSIPDSMKDSILRLTELAGMFYSNTAITALPDWFTISEGATDVSYMFYKCSALTALPDSFTLPSTVTDTSYMFYTCSALASLPDGFTIPDSVTDANHMLYACKAITSLPDSFTIGKSVEDASYMFYNCTALASLPDGFTIPESVTTTARMFYSCTVLASLPAGVLLSSGVTDTTYMFYGCKAITSLPDGFTIPDTVTTTAYMFQNCTSLTALPEGFNIGSSVTTTSRMFYGCTALASLPDGFTIPDSVTTIAYMFYNCTSLTVLPKGFSIPDSVTTVSSAFYLSSSTYKTNPLETTCSSSDYPALSEAIDWSAARRTLVCDHDGTGVAGDITASTCTEGGYTSYTCSVCGDTYTADETEALGHTAGDPVTENEVAATCTEVGSYDSVVYCTVCGEELSRETVTVEAAGHSYEAVVTDPTCTEGGYTTYTCSVCGDTYTADETDAPGHTAADAVVENSVSASCTEAGSYDSVVYCSVCGEELSRETVTVEAAGHSYEAVVTDPTCTEGGYTTYTCSVCGDTYTADETEAPGHTAADAVVENSVSASCTEAGSYDSVVYCSVCGEELSRETVTVEAAGHSYEAVVTDPTCTEGGYTTYTCSVCGDTYTADETDAAGHSYEAVVTDPTCTEGGYTTYTCSVCGDTYTADETDAAGHSYEVTDSQDATETGDGYITYTCSECGGTYTESIAATGTSEEDAEGEIVTNAGTSESAPETSAEVDGEALAAETLTKEEAAVVEEGGSATYSLTVKTDADGAVSESDIAAAEDYLADDDVISAYGELTAGLYLDISLYLTVTDADGNEITGRSITDTGSVSYTIAVTIPEDLINTDSTVTRTYYILRVHDGEAEILSAEYDAAAQTLTFDTDKFSTYAIVYSDSEAEEETETTDDDTEPVTGDESNLSFWMAVAVLSILGLCAVGLKRRSN